MATGEAVQELFFSIKYFYQERGILVAFQQHGMQFSDRKGPIFFTFTLPFSKCQISEACKALKKSTKKYALIAFTKR